MLASQALSALMKWQKQAVPRRKSLQKLAQTCSCGVRTLRRALASTSSLQQQLLRAQARERLSRTRQPTASRAVKRLAKKLQKSVSARTSRRVTAPSRERQKKRKAAKKKTLQVSPGTPDFMRASQIDRSYAASQRHW